MSELEDQLSEEDTKYRFTAVATQMPEKVLTGESTSKLIPLLYTMDSGIYTDPDNDSKTEAYTNLAKVRLKGNSAIVKVKNLAMDEEILDDMNESVASLAEISSFKAVNTDNLLLWTEPESDSLLGDLLKASPKKIAVNKNTGTSICQKIKKINPDIECVTLNINSESWNKGIAMFENYYKKDADLN
mgnify:CR=1 FL=1